MITAFAGVPGSGKSYEAVQKILENLKLGRKVYTNIDGMETEAAQVAIQAYCNLTDFQVTTLLIHMDQATTDEFWLHVEKGSLIILDEVHKNFSNRDWSSDKNKQFNEWMSTHRHQGHDVILITQDTEKIDKHTKTLIEYTYLYSKVNFLGGAVKKKYICYTFHGDSTKGKPMVTPSPRTYDLNVFPCYKSYDASRVKEVGFMRHANVLKHPVFYSIPVVLCLSIFLLSKGSLFKSGDVFGIQEAQAKSLARMESQKNDKKDVQPATQSESFKVSIPQNKVKNAVQVAKVHKEIDSLTQQIVGYSMPNGGIIWTNNGYVPAGGVKVMQL